MVATARISFPDDMTRAVQEPGATSIEGLATHAFERIKDFARDEPVSFAFWAFGIGFVIGWKLKPW